MKKKSGSQLAFLEPRILIGLVIVLAGVLLALVGLGVFFSSGGRHTRCSRDWSSAVCSSDLQQLAIDSHRELLGRVGYEIEPFSGRAVRSEERRVGKECRTLRTPAQLYRSRQLL